eukprot:283939-Rhodomonas_salina.1
MEQNIEGSPRLCLATNIVKQKSCEIILHSKQPRPVTVNCCNSVHSSHGDTKCFNCDKKGLH